MLCNTCGFLLRSVIVPDPSITEGSYCPRCVLNEMSRRAADFAIPPTRVVAGGA